MRLIIKLYYVDVVNETETLVSLDLSSGEQSEIAEVSMFSMSSDGRYISFYRAMKRICQTALYPPALI